MPSMYLDERQNKSYFNTDFTDEQLHEKINQFKKQIQIQDDFFNKHYDDNMFDRLNENEEKILHEKFSTNKESYLSQIRNKIDLEFKKPNDNYMGFSLKILDFENSNGIFTDEIRKKIEEIKEDAHSFSVKHITIMLIGKSGVGKSTLINSLLKLKDYNKALTQVGKRGTVEAAIYPRKEMLSEVPFLRLIDTVGIEISGDNAIEYTIKQCQEKLTEQALSADKNDMVSCIFYCFTGTRVEDDEINFLRKLIKILKGIGYLLFMYIHKQYVKET